MDYRLVLKVLGVGVMAFVFWHFWGIYGLLLGIGVAMVVLA